MVPSSPGRSAKEKIAELQETLRREKADAVLLTLLNSIAWLFNIRGGDISHSPLALAFALVPARGKPSLFIDPAKIGGNVRGHLKDAAELLAPDELAGRLAALGQKAARVRLDPDTTPVRFAQILQAAGAKIVAGDDPCILPKAIKNTAEIAGARAAHIRDGAAMARFLAWLDEHSPSGRVDEIGAAMKLEEFRRDTGELKDLSFELDLGGRTAWRGGALPADDREQSQAQATLALSHRLWRPICRRHHRRDADHRHRCAERDDAAALHAGAQGPYRHRLCSVPQGHARAGYRPVRAAGRCGRLGSISTTERAMASAVTSRCMNRRSASRGTGSVELQPGMILSNEPGLYREGEYGIRLENLVLVTPPAPIKGGTREMLGFETLTLVPFDRRLIDPALLTRDELAWLNAYHAEVRRKIAPLLKGADRSWLREATARIG